MNCTDEKIITLIQQLDRKAESQSIRCLKKCESQTHGVLLKMSLKEKDERQSIFFHSMADFIINVRKKKFILTGEAKICTYLTEIARRKWLNESKKKTNYTDLPESFEPVTKEIENDTNEELNKALRQLEEVDRDILVMFYFYNTDLEEYSKQKGISYDAAKKRISRARTRLKNILKPINK